MSNRLQGTDGIRSEVRLASDPSLAGLGPLEAFERKGVITEKFIELYCYAFVRDLVERGRMKAGESIVVGWDPRDKEGPYRDAALHGVARAGGRPLSIGIVPTPAVPLFMVYRDAPGGIMITASHNPPDQNGIKLFLGGAGLKPLPADDIRLTRKIRELAGRPLVAHGAYSSLEASEEALNCFGRFSLDPRNSWLGERNKTGQTTLIVDSSNGSFSGIASGLFRQMGFHVVDVSADLDKEVNKGCGVVEIEGHREIDPKLVRVGEPFESNLLLREIFSYGKKYRGELKAGERDLLGVVFDGDGDRFIGLVYDPFGDRAIILSGDEIAVYQATFLMEGDRERWQKSLYVNTVESDLNAASHAEEEGFRSVLKGVGDKWILLEAMLASLEAGGLEEGKVDSLRRRSDLSAEEVTDLFNDSMPDPHSIAYAVGAEESGHAITLGIVAKESGREVPLFYGNGFKSAINTIVSLQRLRRERELEAYYQRVGTPYTQGFKKTFYVYYTDSDRITREHPFREELEREIKRVALALFGNDIELETLELAEEPDMVYLAIKEKGALRAGIYVRNSGTEDKTGVNLRGRSEDAVQLEKAGQAIVRFLLTNIKDMTKNYALAEKEVLNGLLENPETPVESLIKGEGQVNGARLLMEMKKGKLLWYSGKKGSLTLLGEWYGKEGRPLKESC